MQYENELTSRGLKVTKMRVNKLKDFADKNRNYDIVKVEGSRYPSNQHRYSDWVEIVETFGSEVRYFAVANRPDSDQGYIERAEKLMAEIGRGHTSAVDSRHCIKMIAFMKRAGVNVYVRKKSRREQIRQPGERYLFAEGNYKLMITNIHPDKSGLKRERFYGIN